MPAQGPGDLVLTLPKVTAQQTEACDFGLNPSVLGQTCLDLSKGLGTGGSGGTPPSLTLLPAPGAPPESGWTWVGGGAG